MSRVILTLKIECFALQEFIFRAFALWMPSEAISCDSEVDGLRKRDGGR
jgi:hypothetical protein